MDRSRISQENFGWLNATNKIRRAEKRNQWVEASGRIALSNISSNQKLDGGTLDLGIMLAIHALH